MKTKSFRLTTAAALLSLSALNFQPSTALAQGTAFRYEGRLSNSLNPVNGFYDLEFALYDSGAPGAAVVAGPVTNTATVVVDGLFTVTLDFGAVFTGAPRWLEIGVRTNGSGSFSLLSPRQELNPTPYAITAENVIGGGLAPGTYGNPVNFNNPANSFCGNGACLTNVNATTLDGLAASDLWRLTGNNVVAGQFLGSLNYQAVEVRANNSRALRLEPTPTDASHVDIINLIGGSSANYAGPGIYGATIGGGGAGSYLGAAASNSVLADFGTVGGGQQNEVRGYAGVVGGGSFNLSSNSYSIVAGGLANTSAASAATVSGGQANTVQTGASSAAIAGGRNNTVTSGSINAFIGAGVNNGARAGNTVVAGGANNLADANAAAIGGGSENHAGGDHAYVGGGQGSTITVAYGTVGGGSANKVDAIGGTVAGGQSDEIQFGATESAIGGGSGNVIQTNCLSSTIGGGKNNGVTEYPGGTSDYAVIAGGEGNSIGPDFQFETVGSGDHSAIGGGYSNTVWGIQSVISGGGTNFIHGGHWTTISGGANNISYFGQWSTIPGGQFNEADGNWSFAAGYRAKAVNQGSFVWADSQNADFLSTTNDQFSVRAHGGLQLSPDTSMYFGTQTRQMLSLWGTQYGIGVQNLTTYFRCDNADPNNGFSWYKGGVHSDSAHSPGLGGVELMRLTSLGLTVNGTVVSASDRNMKENFEPVDGREVLEKVAALPVSKWAYKADAGTRHLGPMAQDFYASFGVGPDDKHIAVVDEGGVALAAIQGLNQKVEEKEARIHELEQRLSALEKLVQAGH